MNYPGTWNQGKNGNFLNPQSQNFSHLPELDTRTHSTLEPVRIEYSTLEPVEHPQEKIDDPSQNIETPPLPLDESEPEAKSIPWWRRHLIVIVVGIIIVLGAIIGGVVGGTQSRGSNASNSNAAQTTSTSDPTSTSASGATPTNNVWIGSVRNSANTTDNSMAFEVTGASDAQCHYQTIVPSSENPCSHPFTLENNITYTWQGCGGDTWLEYGNDNIFLGNCDFSSHEWQCGDMIVKAEWICGLGR